ncbi:MAG: alkane 1-monooxygenase [bacterium]
MRPISVPLFGLAAASPLVLLALSLILGGLWPYLALLYILLAAVALDLLIPLAAADGVDREFPAADVLLILLGIFALIALPALTWAIAGSSGLTLPARLALLLAGGLWFGQVAHPVAHELIHRPRPLFWLGLAVYTALIFGHHTSSHRLVHHRFVASPDDPNSARAGESFYPFARRAWIGSFRHGLRAETTLRAHARSPGLHPYFLYTGGAVAALLFAALIAGPWGAAAWLAMGCHAGLQILLSDYVQHYGLTRPTTDGKPDKVTMAQSWNTPHWFSSALMLNAPRHSDHHAHPSRPYPALRLPSDAPTLPWPMPLACMIALLPNLWRRKMRPVLAGVQQPLRKAPLAKD